MGGSPNLSRRANVTKMFPVYTYFKEAENTWEYAAVCGNDVGQVHFYGGRAPFKTAGAGLVVTWGNQHPHRVSYIVRS